MKSLQYLCIQYITFHTFVALPVHIQHCLFPYTQHVKRLQRAILNRRKARMSGIDNLLLSQLGLDLHPSYCKVHSDVISAVLQLTPGDHLAVLIEESGGVYHHGLYLGVRDGQCKVADFSSPSGDTKMRDGCLRIVSYAEFVKGKDVVCVIPYSGSVEDTAANRENAVRLADLMVGLKSPDLNRYSLLSWNCECFVLMCKTGQYQESEQIKKVFKWINDDIHSQYSVIATVIVAASTSSSCIIS